MQLKIILNRAHKIKEFVYGKIEFGRWSGEETLEVDIHPRRGSRPICSSCGRKGSGYDHQGECRRFEFVPLWGMLVFLLYSMRRVDCPRRRVKMERVPWAEGKNELTTIYRWYLAGWDKRLSWSQAAESFRISWHHVFGSVEMAVEWGRSRMELEGIHAIGIDELQCWLGHKYITVV